MNKIGFVITSLIVVLAIASSMLFVVDQRQFGVVYQLGQIKQVVTEPGLNFKLPPPFQNVSYIDKRLLTLESQDTEPTLTAEKQRVVIDWYVRWRISDPQAYIRNVGTNERAGALQLNRVVRNSFQQEVNKRTLRELLSARRDDLMRDVQTQVAAAIQGANQPMEAERKRVANELRSTGFAEGEAIRADADRQREVIVAEAYRDAQRIKGEGDALAAAAFSDAFGRDPAFARFYRQLEAYKSSFAGKGDVMLVDPSTDFFGSLRSSNVGAPR
jgi:modulator of FtsH protease HflC